MDLTGIPSYLGISFILFLAGLMTVVSKRNIIGIFMGVELILNSAALNFAAFSRLTAGNLEGQMVSLFVIVLAAAEAAIALALLLAIYKRYRDIDADNLTTLKL
ncbi:MAG TPA: NADH-quinone oxidoreductase subunit NuoK [Nitrospirota bacterium]|nr:NADH-quinone oxidoreductase subunit NuoK [Nitrospirota bacterium]